MGREIDAETADIAASDARILANGIEDGVLDGSKPLLTPRLSVRRAASAAQMPDGGVNVDAILSAMTARTVVIKSIGPGGTAAMIASILEVFSQSNGVDPVLRRCIAAMASAEREDHTTIATPADAHEMETNLKTIRRGLANLRMDVGIDPAHPFDAGAIAVRRALSDVAPTMPLSHALFIRVLISDEEQLMEPFLLFDGDAAGTGFRPNRSVIVDDERTANALLLLSSFHARRDLAVDISAVVGRYRATRNRTADSSASRQ